MDDITPENRDALKRDAARFARLVEICPNGIGIFSDKRLIHCNPSLVAMVDVPVEQLIGASLDSLIAPDFREITMRKLDEMYAAGLSHDATCATRLCRTDGAEIDVEASIDELELEGGCDCVVVFRPLASFRNAPAMRHEELLQLTHMHRMAVFGELTASLLHELGQPLTAAKGASELLEPQLSGKPGMDDARRSAEIVAAAATSAASQFQRVWNFVRFRKPITEDVNVSSLLANTVDFVETAARHAGIVLEFRPNRVTGIQADASLLELVFTSLLRRSMTALSSRADGAGKIDVATSQPSDSRVEVCISHNGDILRSELLSMHRVPEEQPIKNPTLTISICRTIVEENGGVFAVEPSADTVGVCYRLIFPVQNEPQVDS